MIEAKSQSVSSQLFYVTFYLCVGFLPVFVGLFDRRGVHIPLIIIGVLILVRAGMYSNVRQELCKQFKKRSFQILFIFIGLVAVYAGYDAWRDPERMRLLSKPVALGLAALLLAFVCANRDRLYQERISREMFYGGIAGFLGVLLLSLWVYASELVGQSQAILPPRNISVVVLNDEIKIIAVFLFFAAAGLGGRLPRIPVAVAGGLALLLLSFWTVGVKYLPDGNAQFERTFSETVNFGLPVALGVLGFSVIMPRVMTHVVYFVTSSLVVVSPWIFQAWFYFIHSVELPRANKFLERGEIWYATAVQALKSPLFGHGLESCRFDNVVKHAQIFYKGDHLWHPHNMFLQIWLDMGLVGVLPLFALIILSWRYVLKLPISTRPLILAGTTMAVIFAVATHSVWQTWVIAIFAFICVTVAMQKSTVR